MDRKASVAYFSMEIAVKTEIPTYSGGLGVLAGDTIRAAADQDFPMVAVTLLYHRGYFSQSFDANGLQHEASVTWDFSHLLTDTGVHCEISIEGRPVQLKVWQYDTKGTNDGIVPIYFLDSRVAGNSDYDASLTDTLYGGDHLYRLCQEAVLGLGGVAALRALGYHEVTRFHMNEGHAALLTLALLEEQRRLNCSDPIAAVRESCVFTTHTPVVAGHDQFPSELALQVLGSKRWELLRSTTGEESLHMTRLALKFSRYVNGVALKHGEVTRQMFPDFKIHAITNGIHAPTWASAPFAALFDRYVPEWRSDSMTLRYAGTIPENEIWEAHCQAKAELCEMVRQTTQATLDPHAFTVGFARRATGYKRALLLFQERERLTAIAQKLGKIQIVFSGKAHPRDYEGKDIIRQIHAIAAELNESVQLVYIPDYSVALAKRICTGVDVWLNTPRPPWEASGTSGMKAALNGIPNLSVLDGWWIEGYIPGATGWAIGRVEDGAIGQQENLDVSHAQELYTLLEQQVLPLYYHDRQHFVKMMRSSIVANGSFFNTHRMVAEYRSYAYRCS